MHAALVLPCARLCVVDSVSGVRDVPFQIRLGDLQRRLDALCGGHGHNGLNRTGYHAREDPSGWREPPVFVHEHILDGVEADEPDARLERRALRSISN